MTFLQVIAQTPADSIPDTVQAVAPPASQVSSVLDMIVQGGWVMVPIFLLSFVAVFLIVERFLTLRRAQVSPEAIMDRIRSYVHAGDIRGALSYCDAQKKPITRILKVGLERLGRPITEIEDAVHAAGKYEAFELEKRTDLLASISGIEPMLGFLGTVTGMIEAFQSIERYQGSVNPGLLAGGIWEALITTVAGLIIGIFAYFFYNLLIARINRVINDMERSATDFIDLLQEPAPRPVRYEEPHF